MLKLESIESSIFEELSNSIIYFQYGINIISTGLNREGKPIKCPIDAIGTIKNDDKTEFVFIEATTTQVNRLKDKWLSKSDDKPGDIIKTYKKAKEFFNLNKNSSFKLFLMTNRDLSGDKGLDLITEVENENFDIPLKIEIMEQGSIKQFLDHDSDGQYLRKKFLQIDAERLSKPLLHKICDENLQAYENFINTTGFNNLIEREELPSIEKHISNNNLSFLIGESGYGKSVISFQILKRHINNGGYGLWISEEFLKNSSNLNYTLDELLHQYCPKLEKNSGFKALNINSNDNFLLIFDDLNRSENPKKLIDKIINWSKNIKSGKENTDENYHDNIRFICPIWQKNMKNYGSNLDNDSNIIIEKLKDEDGIKILKSTAKDKGIVLSDLEVKNYLKKLDNDPFYIGLFISELNKFKNWDDLINNAFQIFLNRKFEELDEEEFLPQDYERILLKLSQNMLENYILTPNLHEIDSWFVSDRDKKILRILIKDRKICYLNNNQNLYFIHDRIKFYYLISACTKIINYNPQSEIFKEPFYAEIIGASLDNIGKNKKFIEFLANNNLLALFASIKYIDDANENYEQILGILTEWSNEKHESYPSFQEEVVKTLYTYDSELVVTLLSNINSLFTSIPCFRNGSTIHGIKKALNIFGYNYPLFKQTIEHVKIHYKSKIIKDIKRILSSDKLNDDLLCGTFLLAGYLGFEELEEIIKSSVKLFEIKEDNLYIILFAAFRCINNDMDFIENLLEKWDMFGKKDDETPFPFIEELRLTFRDYPVTDNVLNYLCLNFQEFSNIKHSIWYICSELNKPLSFKMTLDYLSDNEYLFYMLPFFRRIQISSESRIFLENYYKKEDIKGHSKKYAFRLWAINCNENDLPKLQKIDKDNILFSESLITRIRLGDLTALNSFIKNFNEYVVLNEIHNVWNDEAKLFVEKCFKDIELNENKEIQDGYDYVHLMQCLAKIPLEDAEYYIKQYWDKIKYYRIFIQLNFYLCTNLSIGLNKELFVEIKPDETLFEHFTMNFLYTEGYDKFSTESHFDEIMEYLVYFENFDLDLIFRKAEELGYCGWIRKACQNLDKNQFSKYCKTDKNIVSDMELDDDYSFWQINFENKCLNKNRINDILRLYLNNNQNIESFINVAKFIKENGNRDDLKILYGSNIKEDYMLYDVEFSVKCRTLD